jgi:hypothetical protein
MDFLRYRLSGGSYQRSLDRHHRTIPDGRRLALFCGSTLVTVMSKRNFGVDRTMYRLIADWGLIATGFTLAKKQLLPNTSKNGGQHSGFITLGGMPHSRNMFAR